MLKNKKGLGRGFDALFPEELFDESFDPTSNQDKGKLLEISLNKIEADESQPRKKFDQIKLEELAESIKKHGVLQPIVLVKKGQKYQIVAGERRYRASKIAGLNKIPAIVRTLSDQNKLELSLIENIQREDLNIIEVATVYLKLKEQFNLTLKQIGQSVGGKSVTSISNTLRLLTLPKEAIDYLIEGVITEGQVRSLIGLDKLVVDKLLPQIVKHQWSARRVERVVSNYKKTKDLAKSELEDVKIQKILLADKRSEQLSKKFNATVKIKAKKHGSGGTIEIKFKDQTDFDRISKQLI